MSKELIKKELTEIQKKEVLYLITSGEVRTAQDIISILPTLEESLVVQLLNDDMFYNEVCNYTLAKLKLSYHTTGVTKLLQILNSHDNKESLAALDRLSKLVGAIKEKDNVVINLSLEDLLEEKKEKKVNRKFKPSLNLKREGTGNIFEMADEEEITEEFGEYKWEE